MRVALLALRKLTFDLELGVKFYQNKLLASSLQYWRQLHHRSVLKALELQMKPGEIHYRHSILSKVLKGFQRFVKMQKYEKSLMDRADIQYQRFRMLKNLDIWLQKTSLCVSVREENLEAVKQHKQIILKKSWRKWSLAQDWSIALARKNQLAQRHRKHELLRNVLNGFILNAFYNSKKRLSQQYADIQYANTLLANTFHSWEAYLTLKMNLLRQREKSNQFRKYCNYKIIWNRWCKTIIQKKQQVMKWNFAEASYERLHLKKHFLAFHTYVHNITLFRKEFRRFDSNRRIRFEKAFFLEWSLKNRVIQSHYQKAIQYEQYRNFSSLQIVFFSNNADIF